ncbi:hypothetical protein ONS95_010347 [Cadophora gregata]|uniref:uncharacterized protein n=1 Tax=Cadophora gregata TaxID=51156 RepID=UPI0026DC2511|nr:uncharacterized protein ONS95_010347 [Cadophora gregata]KAK0122084.1 hypothetical protein ONS95_010347 [Cadophora gregata]
MSAVTRFPSFQDPTINHQRPLVPSPTSAELPYNTFLSHTCRPVPTFKSSIFDLRSSIRHGASALAHHLVLPVEFSPSRPNSKRLPTYLPTLEVSTPASKVSPLPNHHHKPVY